MDEYTGGVPFQVSEEKGSYSENITTTQWSPRVTLRCPWNNRHDLINVMTGREWPHGPSGPLVIRPRATGFVISGDGEPTSANIVTEAYEYIHAVVAVSYEQVVGPDPVSYTHLTLPTIYSV